MDNTDKDLVVDPDELLDKCSDWSMAVNSTGLSSMNIGSTFSSFISCGVGTSFFSSLNTAIKKVDSIAYNLATSINKALTEQIAAEEKSALEALDSAYGVDSSKNGIDAVNALEGADTGLYDVDNSNNDLDVNAVDNTNDIELDDTDNNEQDVLLKSIAGDDTELITEDSTSVIEKEVLDSLNLTDGVDEEVLSMAEDEIEAILLEAIISSDAISDLSKTIINDFGMEVVKCSDSIHKVYDFLSKSNNYQGELKNIYLDTNNNDDVNEDVVSFTKYFVDTLARNNNINTEDVLNDTKYQSLLKTQIDDIADSFEILAEFNSPSLSEEAELVPNGDEV